MSITKRTRNYRIISATVTCVTLVLIIVLLLACGLKSQVPPPPPKNLFYVDIVSVGGGGGGGGIAKSRPAQVHRASGQPYATQNAQEAPAINTSESHNPNVEPAAPAKPVLNPDATYHGRSGTGSGGGSGSGIGSGTGFGLGAGTGGGSGGGNGYNTEKRTLMNNIDLNVNIPGQVYVEVHVSTDGIVTSAEVINNSKYKTTITNSDIQKQCVEKAKQARFERGKDEYRVIFFSER